jgi:hypothetical protein
MSRRLRRSLPAAALLLLAAPLLAAESGQEIRINTHTQGQQSFPAVAMDRRGNAVVVWQGDGPDGLGIYGRLFGRTGAPRGDQFLVAKANHPKLAEGESVALDESGFVAVWAELSETGEVRRLFGREMKLDGAPNGRPFLLAESAYGRIALGADGRFLLVFSDKERLFAQLWERSGKPAGDRVTLGLLGDLAAVARHGAGYVVAWDEQWGRVLARFLDAAGQPAGEPFSVADGPLSLGGTSMASAPDGRFVVSWLSYNSSAVFARLFGALGAPLTPVLQAGGANCDGGDGNTSVAMDAEGKFLVTWSQLDQLQELDYGNVYGRRFEASGAPEGKAFRISLFLPGTQSSSSVAAGPAGDFLAAWMTVPVSYAPAQDGSGTGIYGRRLPWARSGSDPCAFGPAGFSCDTAHDGGQAELAIPFHGAEGDRPLLGDLDGDGRDDPCLYHAGTFLCDTAHDGNPAPGIVYGQAGDVPLMADFDGEGRDDACVRRGTWFLCDTAHDGGTAEMAVNFGDAADQPLAGDLDGDGDDDPCVRRGAVFLCDTVHDGLEAEVSISFGKPGDRAFLGDLNGDGRDDPCVLQGQGGWLLCDTAHDGGKAELSLRFTLSGVPLLGDVDGL